MNEKELREAADCGYVWAAEMLEPYDEIRLALRLAKGRVESAAEANTTGKEKAT